MRIVSKVIDGYLDRFMNVIKNIEYIIETLAKQNFECELNVIGNGEQDYVRKLKNYAGHFESINENLSVIFHGFKSRFWVDEELHDSIFLQASYSEGFSNSVLEAIARGSITCVSKQCNMTSLCEDELLNEFDVETDGLNSLLQEIHNNLSHHKKIARTASVKVLTTYSAERLACSLETQLREI